MTVRRPRFTHLTILLALSALASCRAPEVGLQDGRLRPCPSSPNCVSSEPAEERSPTEALAFTGEAGAALERLVALLREQPRAEVVTVTDDYVHAVFRTPLFGFRDDVEFRLDATAGRIHVRSASRVGYSDFGANRRRVDALRERWIGGSPRAGPAR